MTDSDRAEFDAVASDYGECPKAIERDAKGNYLLMHTATGWMWWQAARRAPAAPVPQGWKPVPMEPTPEQLLKVYKQTGVSRKELADLWTAMLTAAPKP